MHICFVLGTIIGLFVPGSSYVFSQFSYNENQCAPELPEGDILENWEKNENATYDFVIDYSNCTPPSSLFSIFTLMICCALSRCGLWLFDLAVNQMFQQWVPQDKVSVAKLKLKISNIFRIS